MKCYQAGTLFFALTYLSSCARILEGPLPSCSQELLNPPVISAQGNPYGAEGLEQCQVSTNNCNKGWLVRNKFTPSAPEHLEVEVDTRRDERGDLFAVIVAQWQAKDDGSIQSLNGTELHVMVLSTNQNLCVRYSFPRPPSSMRNPKGEKWSFTADMVVVDPGQTYMVSVSNLPKTELAHTSYDISTTVTVPGCQDPKIQRIKFCVESGSFWEPNITLGRSTGAQGRSMLDVGFRSHQLSEYYRVLVQCSPVKRNQQWKDTLKNNQTSQSVTFDLEKFPRTCCYIDVEIQPFFPQCTNDCVRQRKTFHICRVLPTTNSPDDPGSSTTYSFVAIGVVLLCGIVGCLVYVLRRRKKRPPADPLLPVGGENQKQSLPKEPPKVLVIYSQDHRLYIDIVLKLCAFLKAKCGAEVLVDFLDNTWVGTVGRLRWLEWQRQQLTNPSDKVLVLCSRGVQAKWRAMCGQGQVTLREDVLSPTDDMLVPFLNLFLPDMHQPAALGKYMVAYFDDVSGEQDVPSVFDIAVKYKLMKHFEELYFRILDIEKYQPGQVNHIEGIGGDEYFNCPSGRALRNAIETFQAYQLENPDWFEMECVENEEEVFAESHLLIDQLQIPPVLECVPLIREGLPIYVNEVEINQNNDSVYILTPELSPEFVMTSVTELKLRVDLECQPVYPQHPLVVPPPEVLVAHLHPHRHDSEPVYVAKLALNEPPQLTEQCLHLEVVPARSQCPTENEEEDFLVSLGQPSPKALQRLLALQQSLGPIGKTPSVAVEVEYPPPLEVSSHSQPVELEEEEAMEPSGKGPSSGSDQGYISKMSSPRNSPVEEKYEDPLMALARLQEELFLNSHAGICPGMS